MAMIGTVLMVVGGIAMLVFGIQILIIAFKKSVWWGLGSLLIPFVIFIFTFMHWAECKTPFMRWLIALVVYVAGVAASIAGGGGGDLFGM